MGWFVRALQIPSQRISGEALERFKRAWEAQLAAIDLSHPGWRKPVYDELEKPGSIQVIDLTGTDD